MDHETQYLILRVAVVVLGGYLMGGIPFGLLVSRLHGIDLRQHGSYNIGATNAGRVLGRKWGLLVLLLDLLKGLLPTLLAGALLVRQTAPGAREYAVWLLAAAACILGHIYPVYLGFRGGKGVATTLGATLGVYPHLTLAILLSLGVWIAVTLTTRYVSLGSLAAALAILPSTCIVLHPLEPERHWPMLVYAVVLPAVVIYQHRGNIVRLFQGTERRWSM